MGEKQEFKISIPSQVTIHLPSKMNLFKDKQKLRSILPKYSSLGKHLGWGETAKTTNDPEEISRLK